MGRTLRLRIVFKLQMNEGMTSFATDWSFNHHQLVVPLHLLPWLLVELPNMRWHKFYEEVLSSEEKAVQFLQRCGVVLFDSTLVCTNSGRNHDRPPCGGALVFKSDSQGLCLRCTVSTCQSRRSIRQKNGFFGTNSNLEIREILELVWYWLMGLTHSEIQGYATKTYSSHTLVEWFKKFRTVCTAVVRLKEPMVGTELDPIQIDESHFGGRRKYNKGRLLKGDKKVETDPLVQFFNKRNGGNRVGGNWVFGLVHGRTDVRLFSVPRRDRPNLEAKIREHCATG